MQREAAKRLSVRLEAVDSNGLLPVRAAGASFATAHAFRRHIQQTLAPHLESFPAEDPLAGTDLPPASVPSDVLQRWPAASEEALTSSLDGLPIDHTVPPSAAEGGESAARAALHGFLGYRLGRYAEDRNHPDLDAGSGLSPYLHFGHLSVHEIFARIATAEGWSPASLSDRVTGSRSGWWGMSPAAEAFLDELITWRELGFNACSCSEGYNRFESLPAWARHTLERHAADARDYTYDLAEFEAAATHDPVWNAAQVQLLREGRIHNYMRMLWGKKILEWSTGPHEALEIMIHLNNKYAIDGRDPNSYTGILWVLGKYDRPWAPERPIFGRVRYMSSENTLRKLRAREYVKRYAP
jgi:deoxyribodipyrimidine photo-lyase